MSKMNFRNFEKFRIFLFLQSQTRRHSDSTGIKILLPCIVFYFKIKFIRNVGQPSKRIKTQFKYYGGLGQFKGIPNYTVVLLWHAILLTSSITDRLGLTSKLSTHNPFLHLIQLHSNMFHSQCKLIFYVQHRTIKSSNVEMSKMNFRNFEKFRIFSFLRSQTRRHSD